MAQLNAERERVAFHFAQIVADDEEQNSHQEAWQELWFGDMTAAEVAEFEALHPAATVPPFSPCSNSCAYRAPS